jgi:YVTN family beta-propeller protein
MTIVLLAIVTTLLLPQAAPPALDFEFFKARVQPIFLDKRPGHARCYSCHRGTSATSYLQSLSPGAATWNDEQSRKNFEAIRRYIIPGHPEQSRLLLHPLAEEAGGDDFHGGGRQFASRQAPEWQTIAAWIRGETLGNARKVRIVQTNSAGDSVTLIDPATNRVAGEIKNIEANHGAAAAPDGSRLYVSNEAESTLDVVDAKTLTIAGRVPLSGHPNNVSISKDGARVYVAIAQAPGAVDVVDTATMTRTKSIPIDGAGHNTFVTPDGRFVAAGSVAGRSLTVIDQATETTVWSMTFDTGVRPMAFDTRADGSTSRIFVQLSDFHGFAIVDFATHKETGRVTLPDVPGATKGLNIQGSPSHGIGIAPDGRTLWVNSKWYHYVAVYSMPDLKLLGTVPVGHYPDWLTFSPDSSRVYVACAGSNWVSVIDVKSRKEVTRIPVGEAPKRNITAVLQ